MTEIWKPVIGYEDLYEVSNLGQVKRIRTHYGKPINRILKRKHSREGWAQYSLSRDGIACIYCGSRLVAEAFIRPLNQNERVKHKDGDYLNDCVSNLQIFECSELYTNIMNEAEAPCRYRSVPIYCIELSKSFRSINEAAKYIGAATSFLNRCIHKNRSCKGYTFIKLTDGVTT